MQNKKIALVHDSLINRGGAERVFQVFCEMFPDAPVYTSVYFPNKTFSYFKKRLIQTTSLQKIVGTERSFKSLFPLACFLLQKMNLSEYDIILSSSTFCGKYVYQKGVKHICYCYTPFRLLWNPDSYYRRVRGNSKVKMIKLVLPILRKWDYSVAQKVNQFIAMTRETQERIQNAYGKNSVIIAPPIDCQKYNMGGAGGEYFLVVSRLEPYKKIDIVIAAFNKLKLPLKIVGTGTMAYQLKKDAEKNIEFFHFISDEDLHGLYQKSIGVILPQKEDYGLVALEANACGKPVICYGKGGVETTMVPYNEENKSEATALFFNDQTVESLMHSIEHFKNIEFNQKALFENARRFDVHVFKDKILKIIENMR